MLTQPGCDFKKKKKKNSKGQISYDITYMSTLKRNDTNKLVYKTERDSDLEKELMVVDGGKEGGRDR